MVYDRFTNSFTYKRPLATQTHTPLLSMQTLVNVPPSSASCMRDAQHNTHSKPASKHRDPFFRRYPPLGPKLHSHRQVTALSVMLQLTQRTTDHHTMMVMMVRMMMVVVVVSGRILLGLGSTETVGPG